MQTILNDIQNWYAAQCDGDWEHSFGVTIGTLDNPGWSVKIDLDGTLLENRAFVQVEKNETEQSWLHCKVENNKFTGYGDPTRLEEILVIFLEWAKAEPEWLAVHYETEADAESGHDQQFLAVLGNEIGPEQCSKPQCERRRIQYSALCRKHHFEMMRGKPAPTDD